MFSTIVLRNKDKDGKSTVYVEYSFDRKVKRFATGIKVAEKYFNKSTGTIKANGTLNVDNDNKTIHTVKANVDSIIRKHIEKHGTTPNIEILTYEYDQLNDTKIEKTFNQYLKDYVETKEAKLKPNSLKQIKSLHTNLLDFQTDTKTKLHFNTINNQVLDKFVNYLTDKEYHNTTVGRRITALKEFLNYYTQAGINTNVKYKLYKFKVVKPKNEEVTTLTVKELEALKALDLTQNKKLERVRDLFILQCWCGLRYSDIVRLNRSHIANNQIRIDITKTEDYSSIPLFPEAETVLKKYDYQIKRISNDKYNEYLKDVCKLVKELDHPITKIHYSGSTRVETTKQKWELIATHTARRTFVTLLLEMGINPAHIMKWSNHSNIKIFQKYINKQQAEEAEAQKVINQYQQKVKALNN